MATKAKREFRVGDRVEIKGDSIHYAFHAGRITAISECKEYTVEFRYFNGIEAHEFFADQLCKL
jgi:hypothetical protein